MKATINLERFAMLLNNQGNLREQWVKQKLAERAEKSRLICEKKKRLHITAI